MNNTIDFKTAKTIDSMSMMGTVPLAFANPLPSLHPLDLLVGLCCGAGLCLTASAAVMMKRPLLWSGSPSRASRFGA